MANHPGDSGDWNTGKGVQRKTPRQRGSTSMSVVSPEVLEAMRQEDQFIAQVASSMPSKRFTDRRPPPGRTRLLP